MLADPKMVMHNADLIPPDFDTPVAISWRATDKPVTEAKRLVPRGQRYAVEKDVIWAVTELPNARGPHRNSGDATLDACCMEAVTRPALRSLIFDFASFPRSEGRALCSVRLRKSSCSSG